RAASQSRSPPRDHANARPPNRPRQRRASVASAAQSSLSVDFGLGAGASAAKTSSLCSARSFTSASALLGPRTKSLSPIGSTRSPASSARRKSVPLIFQIFDISLRDCIFCPARGGRLVEPQFTSELRHRDTVAITLINEFVDGVDRLAYGFRHRRTD